MASLSSLLSPVPSPAASPIPHRVFSARGSLQNGMIYLPSDLISLISRLFGSARDLLSFALLDKRHLSIVFPRNIQDKTSKRARTLLDLHMKKVVAMVTSAGPLKIHMYHILPNGTEHGRAMGYRLKHAPHEEKMKSLETKYHVMPDEGPSWHKNSNYPEARFSERLVVSARQKEAEDIIKQDGYLVYEGQKHFGIHEGKWRDYEASAVWRITLDRERNYADGNLHGDYLRYDPFGNITERSYYANGKQNGVSYVACFSDRIVFSKTHYKEGKRDGEHSTYQIVNDHHVLCSRAYYVNDRLKGHEEHWDSYRHELVPFPFPSV